MPGEEGVCIQPCCVCSFLPCLGSRGCVCRRWLELRQPGLAPPSTWIWVFGQLRVYKPVASLLTELKAEGELQAVMKSPRSWQYWGRDLPPLCTLRCLILTPQMSPEHSGVIWAVLFFTPSTFPSLKSSSLAQECCLSSSGREMSVCRALRLCHTCLLCVGAVNTLLHLLWGWGCPTQLSGASPGSGSVLGLGLDCWEVTLL